MAFLLWKYPTCKHYMTPSHASSGDDHLLQSLSDRQKTKHSMWQHWRMHFVERAAYVRAQYVRMPNTYDSYVLGWNSYFLTKKWVAQPNTYEWLWLSKSYRYRSSSLWKFVSSLRTTRPTAISSKDNSTNDNFVQIQSCLSLQGLVEGHPPPLVGVTWDNSTKSNFAQIQLCPFPLYIYLN